MRHAERRLRAYLAALCAVSLAAAAPARAQSSIPATLRLPGIVNFGEISPSYYRGGEPGGQGVLALAKLGIKTVIDLQMDVDPQESALVGKAGMQYVRIPMTTHTPPTASQQAQFLSLVSDASRQPVYVHCKEGRHRTGVMTALYRMTREGWTAERAFKEMKEYDFGWDFLHPEFKRFVYAYVAPVEGGSSPGASARASN
jgi:protein tyrosine/serine phosphatase